MTTIIKVRRGNKSDSLILTIPKAVGKLYNLDIGDSVELSPMTTDSFMLRKTAYSNKAAEYEKKLR